MLFGLKLKSYRITYKLPNLVNIPINEDRSGDLEYTVES